MTNQNRLTIDELIRQLASKSLVCRYESIEELGRRGIDAHKSIPKLILILDDRSWYMAQGQRKWVREAAVHALAYIDPGSPIVGARVAQVIIELLCVERECNGNGRFKQRKSEPTDWADYWANEGLERIRAFGEPVHRALVRTTSSQHIPLAIAARRVLAAWEKGS